MMVTLLSFKMKVLVVFYLLMIFLSPALTKPSIEDVIKCKTDSDCSEGECCVYIQGRYGSTSCLKVGNLQDECRPGAAPYNVTMSHPSDTRSVELTGLHYMICPCRQSLACIAGTCLQKDQTTEDHPAWVSHYENQPPKSNQDHPTQVSFHGHQPPQNSEDHIAQVPIRGHQPPTNSEDHLAQVPIRGHQPPPGSEDHLAQVPQRG